MGSCGLKVRRKIQNISSMVSFACLTLQLLMITCFNGVTFDYVSGYLTSLNWERSAQRNLSHAV